MLRFGTRAQTNASQGHAVVSREERQASLSLLGAAIVLFGVGHVAGQSTRPAIDSFTPHATTITAPTITSLNPNAATAGGPGFTMTVNGTGYATGTVVLWNGTVLSTTFVSETQLTASVPANLIANAGNANVTVSSPSGPVSNAVAFTISPPPTIQSLSPNSVTAGSPGFTLTVNGTGYAAGSVVQWNGTALTTTYVSSIKLTASVPANLIANAGSANVTVMNPGGAVSNAVAIAIGSSPTSSSCTSEDVANLLHQVPLSSTSHIYATGPYVAGARIVEDARDGAPPAVTLQVSSPGAPGQFCVYFIDDELDSGTPPTYHFPTVRFDHAVRFAWNKQADPTQFGVVAASNTATIYPYSGATPMPFVFMNDAVVGDVGVTFGIGDFAAEPVASAKPTASALAARPDQAQQQPAAACLNQALVVDGGDKSGWVSSGIADGAAADAELINTWLAGRGFTVTRRSQYGPNPNPAFATGAERTLLLGKIADFVNTFTATPTAQNCHHEFFFYFAGHGSKADLVNGQFYRPSIFLYDDDGKGGNQSVSYGDIFNALNAFPTNAQHRTTVYAMFDACYSGSSIGYARARFTLPPANPSHLALQVVTSASPQLTAANGHTVFSSSGTEDFMKNSISMTTGYDRMVSDLGARDPKRLRTPDQAGVAFYTLDP
jgi:hypothetical protein